MDSGLRDASTRRHYWSASARPLAQLRRLSPRCFAPASGHAQGQNEAAWAIGLSGWQTQRRIILPQAFKMVHLRHGQRLHRPDQGHLAGAGGRGSKSMRRAQLAGAATFSFMSALLVAASVCYWALTIFFSFWQAKLRTRMARDKAREKQKGRLAWPLPKPTSAPIATPSAKRSSSRSSICRSTSARTTYSRAWTSRSTRARSWCSSGRPARARARFCAASTSSRTPRPARSPSAASTSPAAATAAASRTSTRSA